GGPGPPVVRVDATAHEQGGEAAREGSWRPAQRRSRTPDGDRLEPGQGHGHAHAAQEGPPGHQGTSRIGIHLFGCAHRTPTLAGSPWPRLLRNWGLVTTLSIRILNRWPLAASRLRVSSTSRSS